MAGFYGRGPQAGRADQFRGNRANAGAGRADILRNAGESFLPKPKPLIPQPPAPPPEPPPGVWEAPGGPSGLGLGFLPPPALPQLPVAPPAAGMKPPLSPLPAMPGWPLPMMPGGPLYR